MLTILIILSATAIAISKPFDETERSLSSDKLNLPHLGKKIYGKPKLTTGEKLKQWTRNSTVNPEELGEYFEGDILVPSDRKNGLIGEFYRWKNAVIPYEIARQFTAQDVRTINAAIQEYHKKTCIRFRPRTQADRDYLWITNTNTGCWSSVGRIGGRQQLNLQSPGCLFTLGTPVHELMHAAGFLHEQSRPERDDYVTILWQNIEQGMEGNFEKADKSMVTAFGISYDYGSVMHYSSDAFSANGNPTIVPKKQGVELGQRDGFSQSDIDKLNRMYNCKISGK